MGDRSSVAFFNHISVTTLATEKIQDTNDLSKRNSKHLFTDWSEQVPYVDKPLENYTG